MVKILGKISHYFPFSGGAVVSVLFDTNLDRSKDYPDLL